MHPTNPTTCLSFRPGAFWSNFVHSVCAVLFVLAAVLDFWASIASAALSSPGMFIVVLCIIFGIQTCS